MELCDGQRVFEVFPIHYDYMQTEEGSLILFHYLKRVAQQKKMTAVRDDFEEILYKFRQMPVCVQKKQVEATENGMSIAHLIFNAVTENCVAPCWLYKVLAIQSWQTTEL